MSSDLLPALHCPIPLKRQRRLCGACAVIGCFVDKNSDCGCAHYDGVCTCQNKVVVYAVYTDPVTGEMMRFTMDEWIFGGKRAELEKASGLNEDEFINTWIYVNVAKKD